MAQPNSPYIKYNYFFGGVKVHQPHILPLLACQRLLHKMFSYQAVHTINYSILLSAKHLSWKYLLLSLLVETGWFEQPSVPTLFVSLMSPFSFHMVASYGLYGETRQNFRIPSVNHILVYLVHQCATSLILRPKQGKCLPSWNYDNDIIAINTNS